MFIQADLPPENCKVFTSKKEFKLGQRDKIVSAFVETNGWNIPTQVTFILFMDPLITVVEKQKVEFQF